jgi:hypothetical protein
MQENNCSDENGHSSFVLFGFRIAGIVVMMFFCSSYRFGTSESEMEIA